MRRIVERAAVVPLGDSWLFDQLSFRQDAFPYLVRFKGWSNLLGYSTNVVLHEKHQSGHCIFLLNLHLGWLDGSMLRRDKRQRRPFTCYTR